MSASVQELLELVRPAVRGRNRGMMQRYFGTSDVLQEVAIQLLDEIDKAGDEGLQATQSWLRRLGRGHANKLRVRYSAKKRGAFATVELNPDDAIEDTTPDQIVECREHTGRAVACLAQLDQLQRTIIHRYDIDGLAFREIGEEMRRTECWVRRQYHVAILRLKIMLAKGA